MKIPEVTATIFQQKKQNYALPKLFFALIMCVVFYAAYYGNTGTVLVALCFLVGGHWMSYSHSMNRENKYQLKFHCISKQLRKKLKVYFDDWLQKNKSEDECSCQDMDTFLRIHGFKMLYVSDNSRHWDLVPGERATILLKIINYEEINTDIRPRV